MWRELKTGRIVALFSLDEHFLVGLRGGGQGLVRASVVPGSIFGGGFWLRLLSSGIWGTDIEIAAQVSMLEKSLEKKKDLYRRPASSSYYGSILLERGLKRGPKQWGKIIYLKKI